MANIPRIKRHVALIDVKASGLMSGSFPVEVGYLTYGLDALKNWSPRVSSHIVRPDPFWTLSHWDSFAEQMHGLSHDHLRRFGEDTKSIAAHLQAELANHIVFTDVPDYDAQWLDVLHASASRPRTYKIYPIERLQKYIGLSPEMGQAIFNAARKKHGPTHRVKLGLACMQEVFEKSLEAVYR
jgi:hypothetical protein